MKCTPRRELRVVPSLLFLLAGCIDFSVDNYCAENSSLCLVSINRLEPDRGSSNGGTLVRAYGLALEADTTVELDGITVEDLRRTDVTSLQFKAPPHPPGLVSLKVHSRGETFVLPAAFEYLNPPRIDSVSPTGTSTEGGRRMSLSGTHLTPDTVVFLGNRPAEVISQTSERIEFFSPPGESGLAEVRVENDLGSTALENAVQFAVPWEDRAGGLGSGEILKLLVHPSDVDQVIALTSSGRFSTLNGGRLWQQDPSELLHGVTDLAQALSQPSRLYAATPGGLIRSDDGGANWRAMGSPQPVLSVSVDPTNTDRLIVGGTGRVWTSVDGGETLLEELLPISGEVRAVALPAEWENCWFAAIDGRLLVRTQAVPWSVSGGDFGVSVERLLWDQSSRMLAVEFPSGVAISSSLGDHWDYSWWSVQSGVGLVLHQGRSLAFVTATETLQRCADGLCVDVGLGLRGSAPSAVAVAPSRPEVVYVGDLLGRVQRTEIATW